MLVCPLCNDWLLVGTLCEDCKKVRGLYRIVGKERFMNAIERAFIIQENKGMVTRSKVKLIENQVD